MSESIGQVNTLDAIYERRSVRSYSTKKLDHVTIAALLKAAVWAPTAVHEEPWAFAIVQDSAYLKRLSDRAKPLFIEEAHRAHLDRGGHTLEMFSQPDFNIFYNAGTLIVICGKPMGPFVVGDCWLAADRAQDSIGVHRDRADHYRRTEP